MVSQMLLGETAQVLEQVDRWIRIKTTYDAYEGWVNPGQCAFISAETEKEWLNEPRLRRSYHRNYIVHHLESGDALCVPTGALLVYTDEGIRLPDGEYLKADINPPLILTGNLIETAERLLGIPYLWGGRSDLGIDCSGFVQLLFSLYGFTLPRDSGQQYQLAKPTITDLHSIQQAQSGDLVFFANPEKRITHVGIYITDGCLIHAGPNVRINCFAPKWADRVPYPFDQRLADRFCGIIRITDLCLPWGVQPGHSFDILEDRSPQILNTYA
jgi:cell wall-associated NlpC family hydrolase